MSKYGYGDDKDDDDDDDEYVISIIILLHGHNSGEPLTARWPLLTVWRSWLHLSRTILLSIKARKSFCQQMMISNYWNINHIISLKIQSIMQRQE